jgi:hypothetical protein
MKKLSLKEIKNIVKEEFDDVKDIEDVKAKEVDDWSDAEVENLINWVKSLSIKEFFNRAKKHNK